MTLSNLCWCSLHVFVLAAMQDTGIELGGVNLRQLRSVEISLLLARQRETRCRRNSCAGGRDQD